MGSVLGAAAAVLQAGQEGAVEAGDGWAKPRAALGVLLILLVCWACSTNRRAIRPRIVLWGLGLQIVFALVVLRTRAGDAAFRAANDAVLALLSFANRGIAFLLGPLADPAAERGVGYVFLFQTLPTIIFFASLMSVLYHFGVLQRVVAAVAWGMRRTMKTSGAETLSAAANIFVGQTEAPLLVRPFLPAMTRSEMMAVMTGGFATVAGGVLAAYVGMLHEGNPQIAGHLMAASVMAAPTALMIAKILVPEEETPATAGGARIRVERTTANAVDAAAGGAADGLHLVLNVAAMLLAFVAMVALLDALVGGVGGLLQRATGAELFAGWSLTGLLGKAFAPLAWLIGVSGDDVSLVGRLLGEKLVLTEFIAYQHLGAAHGELSERSYVIASYALCGFANFASIAIQIGGIGAMAPERRADLARLGGRAMIAGFLTTCVTAAVAGILYTPKDLP